jgi:hypothetical protein
MTVASRLEINASGRILLTITTHFEVTETINNWRTMLGMADPTYAIQDEGTSGSISGNTLVDPTKTWGPNEWAGYVAKMPNYSSAEIVSNTADTLILDGPAVEGEYVIWSHKYRHGWIRASSEDNPFVDTGPRKDYDYFYMYWDPSTPAPHTDYARASILFARHPDNALQGVVIPQEWEVGHMYDYPDYGYKRLYWGEIAPGEIPAGTDVVARYLLQLGTQGSDVLPDITNQAVADELTAAFLSESTPPEAPKGLRINATEP